MFSETTRSKFHILGNQIVVTEYLIPRRQHRPLVRVFFSEGGIKMGGRSVMPASAETRIDQGQELPIDGNT